MIGGMKGRNELRWSYFILFYFVNAKKNERDVEQMQIYGKYKQHDLWEDCGRMKDVGKGNNKKKKGKLKNKIKNKQIFQTNKFRIEFDRNQKINSIFQSLIGFYKPKWRQTKGYQKNEQ